MEVTTEISPAERYAALLRSIDWDYDKSDDYGVVTRTRAKLAELNGLKEIADPDGSIRAAYLAKREAAIARGMAERAAQFEREQAEYRAKCAAAAAAKSAQAEPTTAVAEYRPTEAALSDLEQRYGNVAWDCSTTKGDKDARAVRHELVGLRTSVEKTRRELKAPLIERGRLIDAEAKRITGRISALEAPVDEAIRQQEAVKEAARAERERQERERVASIMERIGAIRHATFGVTTSAEIRTRITEVEAMPADAIEFGEFAQQAQDTKSSTLQVLEGMEKDALERERIAAEQKAEAERVARERAELEAQRKAEAEKLAQERAALEAERQAEAAEMEAERQKIARAAAEVEAQRQAQIAAEQKAEADRQARIAAEQAQLRAEAAKAERARQEKAEAEARAAREAVEKAEAERRAKEAAERAERERKETALRRAAPALFAALDAMVGVFTPETDDQRSAFETAQAALAQARGEE